jgi:hypothetical protein
MALVTPRVRVHTLLAEELMTGFALREFITLNLGATS